MITNDNSTMNKRSEHIRANNMCICDGYCIYVITILYTKYSFYCRYEQIQCTIFNYREDITLAFDNE